MKKLKSFYLPILIVYMVFLFITGCKNYYKAVGAPVNTVEEKATAVTNSQMENRYFILRNGDKTYQMKNIRISENKKMIECTLDSLPWNHMMYVKSTRSRDKVYDKGKGMLKMEVLNEVHLYILPDVSTQYGAYSLNVDDIKKIELIEKDSKRTSSSHLLTGVGVTLGVLLLLTIIVAATKSSCPFVSAYDGEQFSLQGEVYGGAIYPQLARHDYLPLKMEPMQDGSLHIKITNELKERQYTDLAELWVITHDKNSRMLADEQGNLYSFSAPQPAIKAVLNNNIDITAVLANAGDHSMLYMDDTTTLQAGNEVILTFNKPANAKHAKLFLNLKNSYFLDLLYGELAKGFGTYYNRFVKEQRSKPIAELLQWTKDQQIPLTISIKTINGWKKITDISTIGPLSHRSMAVPIEIPETNEPITQIKLSSGFMFWEIDQAAIDYSSNAAFTVQKLLPVSARDEAGANVMVSLQKEDGIHLEQPQIGNSATIVYQPSTNLDLTKTRTYILHAKDITNM